MPGRLNELNNLLEEPRETLDVELKEDLEIKKDKNHRALIAKEIIALANNGGGYLIIGYREHDDGSYEPKPLNKNQLSKWSTDNVQSIIEKYVDPTFQCEVHHVERSNSTDKFPIIIVPGNHKVPVRSKAGSPDGKTITQKRVYVRRPGPTSEEPQTTTEWDQLFDRIIRNRRSELLDAMRSIIEGTLPTVTAAEIQGNDNLSSFREAGIKRWERLVSSLPYGATPKFPLGFYDCSFEIEEVPDHKSLAELRDVVRLAVRDYTGWPAFLMIDREPFTPKPVDGSIEFWRGPEKDGTLTIAPHHDFWRISPNGLFFTRRGYPEDGVFTDLSIGKYFDLTYPIQKLAETVMEVALIARDLAANHSNINCHFQFSGLKGRELVSIASPGRIILDGKVCQQEAYEARTRIAVQSLPDLLPELVSEVMSPLYELFDFFVLPKRLVEEEIQKLLSRHH